MHRDQSPQQFSLTTLWNDPSLDEQRPSQRLPVVRVQLIRERLPSPRIGIEDVEDAAKVLASHLEFADREHFVAMMLNAQNELIGVETVSIGTLTAALVSPSQVFKAAILANAVGIIVGHNHPSGDPEPSPEDIQVTRVLRRAGAVLDIEVVDHIVVGDQGRFVSLRRRGHFTEKVD